ncbi:hypothetical protein MBLNU230_g0448t1 [Neophaeotheca triangularis]
MVKFDTIQEANAKASSIVGLVCVFVGGTGGIGESTIKELFKRTTRPKAYIVGRNIQRGNDLVKELTEINPDGKAYFLQQDISVLQRVDETCRELQRREKLINCLFLTAGYMTLSGRNETPEGLDHKMTVNFYARMRFIRNLMPELTAASRAGETSRCISVLAAGAEGDVNLHDLDLRRNFTLHSCLAHCAVMTDFAVEELAKKHPGTSFSHSYPGTVKTGIANQLTGPVRLAVKVLYAVMTPWLLNVQESGVRHLFQITNQCYPSANGGVGVPIPEDLDVIIGSNGEKGSGGYLLDWDGKDIGDPNLLRKYREFDLGPKVMAHLDAMFEQAEAKMKSSGKRAATDEAEGSGRPGFNPIGWRPA